MNATNQKISARPVNKWIKDAWHLTKPYWYSHDKHIATILIGLIITINLLMVYISVLFNTWYNDFYDAIQKYDKSSFFNLLSKWCVLALIFVAFSLITFYLRKILELRWRRWLTKYYLDMWFTSESYHKHKYIDKNSDNPDQRISEDINSFLVLSLDLFLGFITSIVTLISFVSILWSLSGELKFNILHQSITIKGYMVWVALLYAIFGTYITFKIGNPLVKLDFDQQAYEADFRFSLARVREHSENIAFYRGTQQEKQGLLMRYNNIVNNFLAIIMRQLQINFINIGYGLLAALFPIVVSAPRYFSRQIQLGGLIQIGNAFGKVQDAFSYFMNAYTSLAGWRATMDRLYGFQLISNQSLDLNRLPIRDGYKYLELINVELQLPNGKILAQNINLSLDSGDSILIQGRSGSGKTTLLRTIAGIWHFADGELKQKPNLSSLFIAQKPYLPIGTLYNAICYPKASESPNISYLSELMQKCELSHLITQLNEVKNWDGILSVGEQQRIAFCRILINQPDIIYLDEATSAIDEQTENKLYELIKNQLPRSLIISIGHRSTIAKWHNQVLNFNNYCLADNIS